MFKNYLCSKCKTEDPSRFKSRQKSICRKCTWIRDKSTMVSNGSIVTKNSREYARQQKSPESFLSHQLTQLMSISRRSIKTKDVCDLNSEYLMGIWSTSNGRCQITKLPMTHVRKDPSAVSIDRIDNNKGHVVGNIQLVCTWVNLAKGVCDNLDNAFMDLECNRTDVQKRRFLLRRVLVSRGACKTQRTHLQHIITIDDAWSLLEAQGHKCAVTGYQMSYVNDINAVSIDRIDNDLGYYFHNIRLVRRWVNIARRDNSIEKFDPIVTAFIHNRRIT